MSAHFDVDDQPGRPVSAEDIWEQVVELKHEIRERHKDFKFSVGLGLILNLIGIAMIIYKLYFSAYAAGSCA